MAIGELGTMYREDMARDGCRRELSKVMTEKKVEPTFLHDGD